MSSHAPISGINDARAVDVILRLIRAQGRVVRWEARTDQAASSMVSKVKLTCSSSRSNIITSFAAGCMSGKLRARGPVLPAHGFKRIRNRGQEAYSLNC